MKKFTAAVIALTLAVLSVFMLSACGKSNNAIKTDDKTTKTDDENTKTDDKASELDAEALESYLSEGLASVFNYSNYHITTITETSVSSDEPDYTGAGMDKQTVDAIFKNWKTDDYVIRLILSYDMPDVTDSIAVIDTVKNVQLIYTKDGYYLGQEPYDKFGFTELSEGSSIPMTEIMSTDPSFVYENEIKNGLLEYAKVTEHEDGSKTIECRLGKDEVMKVCKSGVDQTLDYLDLTDGEVAETSALYIFDLTKDGTISRIECKTSLKVLYSVDGNTYHCEYNDSFLFTATEIGADFNIDIPDESKTLPMDEYWQVINGTASDY